MKSKKRLEMGEKKWMEYQEQRKRKKSIRWYKSKQKKIEFHGKLINDLSGLRSGLLVAVAPSDKESYGGKTKKENYWKCRCDCGKETIVAASRITGKEYKSCGCLRTRTSVRGYTVREDKAKANEFIGAIPIRKYHKIEENAKARKLEFSVSIEYLDTLFKAQNGLCPLSGRELYFFVGGMFNKATASLDRIDNSKGYVEGNVRWVHKDVNMLKKRMSDATFVKFCRECKNIVIDVCRLNQNMAVVT